MDFETFLRRLESSVTSCKAPHLALTVKDETRRKIKKVFDNKFIERLSVTAPCNLNLHLVMPRLQQVDVHHPEPSRCTYHRSPVVDRDLHRPGLCCVSLASLHGRCPAIQVFAGLRVGHVRQDLGFAKWSARLKRIFYSDYLASEGEQEMKTWARARGGRWFVRQEPVPEITGHGREDF